MGSTSDSTLNNFQFSLHFIEHIEVGVFYAFLFLIMNLVVMRRYIYSVFDPLLFFIVLSAAGGAVVPYLYHFDLIGPVYLWSYIGTQLAFTAGFLLVRPPAAVRSPIPTVVPTYTGPIQVLYPLSVVFFITAQLTVYSVIGLPIFLESRLETFADGGGFGSLSRIIFVTSSISLVCAVYRLTLLKRSRVIRILDSFVLIFCVVVALLSGSKGALLALIFNISLALFFARRFYGIDRAEMNVRRFFILLVASTIPVAFVTIYVQSGIDNLLELAGVVAMRFFQSGEIYFMVYPNDILNRLQDGNGLLALFYSPLGSLRLIPRESLPINLGLQAFWYHYDTSLLSGPNARHNVFGLFYFGPWFSLLFSFVLGLTYSIARNSTYRMLSRSPIGMTLYVLIVSCAMYIEQDVAGQAIEYLFSVIVLFPILYVISYSVSLARHHYAPRALIFRSLDQVRLVHHGAN